jgi:uncharacterized protein YcbK (DUF882 family)
MLSAHFSLAEFVASDLATRHNIDNSLPRELLDNATQTAQLLERIRARLGEIAGHPVPMQITSGYRSPALNALVGSSVRSDHLLGLAADFRAPSFGTPEEICKALAPEIAALGIGQLINEFPAAGWVHVSPRLQALAINRVITIDQSGTRPGIMEA